MKPLYSLLGILVLAISTTPACAMQEADQSDGESAGDATNGVADEDSKTFYALGLAVSQGLTQFHLTEEELEAVQQGLADGVLGNEPKVDPQQYMMQLQQLAQSRAEAAIVAERQEGAAFLAEAAAGAGVVKSDSGLIFQSLEEGSGESPAATDRVSVHYRGTLRDGTVFDSSYDRGEPATFGLDQVIPCWTEGVQRLQEGGKAKLICPPDLAYGDRQAGSIPAGSTLIFEVELLEVVGEAPEAQATPSPTPAPEPEPAPPPG